MTTPRTAEVREGYLTGHKHVKDIFALAEKLELELDAAKKALFLEEQNRNELAILGEQNRKLTADLAAAREDSARLIDQLHTILARATRSDSQACNTIERLACAALNAAKAKEGKPS